MSCLDEINRYTFLCLLCVLTLLLPGCMMLGDRGPTPSTEPALEIDLSLTGLDYRLRRLAHQRSRVEHAEETIESLHNNLRELRTEFKRLLSSRDHGPSFDSAAIDLRDRVDDLAIRYMAATLGQLISKDHFLEAVETRFDDLDRELAVLEGSIFHWELRDEFDESISRLYEHRDRVALRLSETASASELEFAEMKTGLASSIGRLDVLIAHTTMQVDHAYNAKHPIRSIDKLWL
ncbi:MAG TPA: hypothetical protein VMO47_05095 [Rhodothermales bacterium]|nr:hypothetical protein [Rhodothermales bacterium]